MCYVHSNRIPQNNLMSTVLGVPVGHKKQIVWRLSFPVRFNGLATLYKPLSRSSNIYLALLETDQAEPLAYKHRMVGDIFLGQKLGTITLFNKMQHNNEWIKGKRVYSEVCCLAAYVASIVRSSIILPLISGVRG